MLCSNLGNENSDAGHIKCSHGPQAPRPWAKRPCFFPTPGFSSSLARLLKRSLWVSLATTYVRVTLLTGEREVDARVRLPRDGSSRRKRWHLPDLARFTSLGQHRLLPSTSALVVRAPALTVDAFNASWDSNADAGPSSPTSAASAAAHESVDFASVRSLALWRSRTSHFSKV